MIRKTTSCHVAAGEEEADVVDHLAQDVVGPGEVHIGAPADFAGFGIGGPSLVGGEPGPC